MNGSIHTILHEECLELCRDRIERSSFLGFTSLEISASTRSSLSS